MLFSRNKNTKTKDTFVRKAHITCPYCMNQIKPGEILFMTDEGEHLDEEFVSTAARYQFGSARENATGTSHNHTGIIIQPDNKEYAFHVDEKTGYPVYVERQVNGSATRVYSDRICPKCHCYLPNDIESMDLYNIVVLGNTSCGKTSLLASMLYEMGSDYAALLSPRLGQIRVERDSAPFLQSIINNWKGSVRDSTVMGLNVFPIVFRATSCDNKRRILVAIHDFAGEGMKDLSYFANQPISRRKINGIMMVVDVCQLNAFRKRNIEYACEIPVTQIFSDLNDEAKKTLQQADSVAIVLTKFDALALNQVNDGRAKTKAYTPGLEDHASAVSIQTIKDVSGTVKRILAEDTPANITSIQSTFLKVSTAAEELGELEYFATSSMQIQLHEGENTRYTNVFESSRQLHRVQEPMLYFLARWNIFPTKLK